MPGTRAPLNTGHHTHDHDQPVSAGRALGRALDVVLFSYPFVLLDQSNRAVGSATGTLGEALLRLRDSHYAVTVAGTLVDGMKAVDIDLVDGVDPMLGEVALERLVAWCVARDLRYQPRESGRAGHGHLIVRLGDGVDLATTADLQAELELHLAQLAAALPGVRFDLRSALRPLSAPHRHGRATRLLQGTLRPQDVPTRSQRSEHERRAVRRRSAAALRTARDQRRSTGALPVNGAVDGVLVELDDSPSGREYGAACAMARAGYTAARAWPLIGSCAVSERGLADWLRFHWLPAVTTVAAEQGLAAEQAWALIERECPAAAEGIGRGDWLERWQQALVEAQVDRPRRFRVPRYPGDQGKPAPTVAAATDVEAGGEDHQASGDDRTTGAPVRQHEVEQLRLVLRTAAVREVTARGRRAQVAESMGALMDTLAEAIAVDGRISQRRLAEASHLSRSTVQLRRSEALRAGLVRVVASYAQDGQACDVYALGPTTQQLLDSSIETRSRSCTPPLPRLLGHADPEKARARHQAERTLYSAPTLSSAHTEAIEAAYPHPVSPAKPLVRSRLRQRQWWDGLSEAEQEQRREACRTRLDAMPTDDRDTWIQWLAKRDLIDASIDRVLDGTALQIDREVVERAPLTVHHGRRDPLWRVGGTRPTPTAAPAPQKPVQGQLDLPLSTMATAERRHTTAHPRRQLTLSRADDRHPQRR